MMACTASILGMAFGTSDQATPELVFLRCTAVDSFMVDIGSADCCLEYHAVKCFSVRGQVKLLSGSSFLNFVHA